MTEAFCITVPADIWLAELLFLLIPSPQCRNLGLTMDTSRQVEHNQVDGMSLGASLLHQPSVMHVDTHGYGRGLWEEVHV